MLKYVVPEPGYPFSTLYFGIANVIANGLIMLRCVAMSTFESLRLILADRKHSSVVLWVSQNIEDDYTYNLAL